MAETFDVLLRAFRRDRSLSQEELAERAGLSAAAVGALERGDRRHPYPHTVAALATAMELTAAERAQLLAAVPSRGGDRHRGAPSGTDQVPLPRPLTPLVGRASELALVADLLGRQGARWVTLTGPGGVGKTRLAIEAAHALRDSFPDGVVLVDLAHVRSGDLVAPEIVKVLGLPEDAEGHTWRVLARYLGARHLLLVLDNLEQIIGAAPPLVELVEGAPAITVLGTSRGALRIRGEHEVQLSPLAVPGETSPGAPLTASEELLRQRIREVLPDFDASHDSPHVAAICRQLDGMPLALELAAAQLRYTSLAELRTRLQDRLAPLYGPMPSLPPRQRSLRASVRWSFDLLSSLDRHVFARAAVFEGGFTLAAAAEVCAVPAGTDVRGAVASLVDRSLLTVSRPPAGAARFEMLETLRAFALERLDETGERPATAARHARYFCELAEEAAPHLPGSGREPWVAALDDETGNLNAALAWGEDGGDSCVEMRLVAALGWFWLARGRFAEGRRWAASALLADSGQCGPEVTAGVHYTAAGLAWKANEFGRARELVDSAVAVARGGDGRRLALALSLSGLIAISESRSDSAIALLEESLTLFQRAQDAWGVAYARSNLGDALVHAHDPAAADAQYRESLAGFLALGDKWGQALVLHMLASVAHETGDAAGARALFGRAVDLCREFGSRENLARGLIGRAATALALGDLDLAEDSLLESLEILDGLGMSAAGAAVRGLAAVCAARGEFRQAATLFGAAEAADAHGPLFMVGEGLFDEQRLAAVAALGSDAFSVAAAAGRADWTGERPGERV